MSGWIPADQAPKDGSQILGVFKTLPYPAMAMWNKPSEKWVVATCATGVYEGEWQDTYFENEHYDDSELKVWMEVPK